MRIFFNLRLPFPWQLRFPIFSIFHQYFELKIAIFWTALPKRQCGKCLCLCLYTINITKYFTLVLILLFFRFHGKTCFDKFVHAITHFSMHNFQSYFSKHFYIIFCFLSQLVN